LFRVQNIFIKVRVNLVLRRIEKKRQNVTLEEDAERRCGDRVFKKKKKKKKKKGK